MACIGEEAFKKILGDHNIKKWLTISLIWERLFIFLILFFSFLAVLGLPCCVDFSPVMANGDSSLVVVREFLLTVASLVTEHGLWGTWVSAAGARGLSGYSSQAAEHRLNSCGAQI